MSSIGKSVGLCLLVNFALQSIGYAHDKAVQQLIEWQARHDRVQNIARAILSKNLVHCTRQRNDFGFVAVSINPSAKPEVQQQWVDAFGNC